MTATTPDASPATGPDAPRYAPPATPQGYFDRMYADGPDPWLLRERWYERRKQAMLVAALPQERYRRAFEPGCASGVLTERLADRCDEVVAADRSEVALAAARRALAGRPHVRFVQAAVPQWWPAGQFDLVVLAELAYYLDDDALEQLFARARASLAVGGTLVAVHWRHPVADHVRPGDDVHDRLAGFAAATGLSPVSRTVEEDFRLDVLVDATTGSVARATGVPGPQ